MSQRSPRPANMPWVSPCLTVKDPAAALEFYQKAFGFGKKDVFAGPDGTIMHAEVTWHDMVIMFGPECPTRPEYKAPASSGHVVPVSLYVYCDDVDALYARATAAGAKGEQAPETMFWGDRVCKLVDPEGYSWGFATNVAECAPLPTK